MRTLPLALTVWALASPAFAVRPITPPAPEFPKGSLWLNAEELSLDRLRGRRVIVVAFINVDSLNSIRTFPALKAWWDRYLLNGLMVIGVHNADFEAGRDPVHVRSALKHYDIRFPVMLDNNRVLWKAYQNEGWPVTYLIDPKGNIVYDRLGEGGYREFEEEILDALRRFNGYAPPARLKLANDPPAADCGPATSTLYLGSRRGRQKNLEGVKEPRRMVTASRDGEVAYRGRWTLESEALRLSRGNPGLNDFARLIYRGAEAAALMGTESGQPVRVFLKQGDLWLHGKNAGQDVEWDDDDRSYVMVSEPRLYYLTKNSDDAAQELLLYPTEAGVGISGFDFSNWCQTQTGGR